MEREGKAGGGRVSIGSSCVVCFVVCACVWLCIHIYVSNLCSDKKNCLNPVHKYIVGNKLTKVHSYIRQIMARLEKGDKQSPYSKNM